MVRSVIAREAGAGSMRGQSFLPSLQEPAVPLRIEPSLKTESGADHLFVMVQARILVHEDRGMMRRPEASSPTGLVRRQARAPRQGSGFYPAMRSITALVTSFV